MATSFQGAEGSTEDLTHYVTGSYHFDPSRSGVIDCFAAMFCYVLLCFAMFCFMMFNVFFRLRSRLQLEVGQLQEDSQGERQRLPTSSATASLEAGAHTCAA